MTRRTVTCPTSEQQFEIPAAHPADVPLRCPICGVMHVLRPKARQEPPPSAANAVTSPLSLADASAAAGREGVLERVFDGTSPLSLADASATAQTLLFAGWMLIPIVCVSTLLLPFAVFVLLLVLGAGAGSETVEEVSNSVAIIFKTFLASTTALGMIEACALLRRISGKT